MRYTPSGLYLLESGDMYSSESETRFIGIMIDTDKRMIIHPYNQRYYTYTLGTKKITRNKNIIIEPCKYEHHIIHLL